MTRSDQDAVDATLEVTVETVVYRNDSTGFAVVKVRAEDGRLITAVGDLALVQEGEHLRLKGRWETDRRYGPQMRVRAFLPVRPETIKGIQRYLSSGLVEGIGAEMAKRLVTAFGMDTLDVIDRQPERLTDVQGIGPIRKGRILEAWQRHHHIREVMVFLQAHGLSTSYASRIIQLYGEHAVQQVQRDPYRLAVDIRGVGFHTADAVAEQLGVPRDSQRRAVAGLLHVLGELAGEGHTYCPRVELLDRARELLGVHSDRLGRALDAAAQVEVVIVDAGPAGEQVALPHLAQAEVAAAGRLRALLDADRVTGPPGTGVVSATIEAVEKQGGWRLAQDQRLAVTRALTCKVMILTGGPGTGKTTTVQAMLHAFERERRRVLLCAPTGRAAKRLSEATGHEARTLHRLLEFVPASGAFARNAGAPLDTDALIVDEASMLDVVLFDHLLEALPPTSQLLLVGDVDQLPSVGPGNVLADLIRSDRVPVVRLTEVFRQASRSRIVVNAHRVNRGQPLEDLGEVSADSDFYFIQRNEPDLILEAIKELVKTRIPRRFGLAPLDDVQVLSPMHKGLLGTANLNQELQALFEPRGEAVGRGGRRYRVGDKVMQVRNNYDLNVFNGDIGRVVAVDPVEGTLAVRMDERVVDYHLADLEQLTLAYACSIHKAQGSEYPAVVVPIHTQHYVMLRRNLLYTAITRARRLAVLVGSRRAVTLAIETAGVQQRYTRLAALLV